MGELSSLYEIQEKSLVIKRYSLGDFSILINRLDHTTIFPTVHVLSHNAPDFFLTKGMSNYAKT